jgi:hypothetical protein
VGIAVGTVIQFVNPFQSKALPIPLPALVIACIGFGIVYSVFIVGFSVPVWRVLAKIRRTTLFDALALGFLMTVIVFAVSSMVGGNGPSFSYLRLVEVSAMFGVAGAIAGAVTWAVARSGTSA